MKRRFSGEGAGNTDKHPPNGVALESSAAPATEDAEEAKIQRLMEGVECRCHVCDASILFVKLKEHLRTHLDDRKDGANIVEKGDSPDKNPESSNPLVSMDVNESDPKDVQSKEKDLCDEPASHFVPNISAIKRSPIKAINEVDLSSNSAVASHAENSGSDKPKNKFDAVEQAESSVENTGVCDDKLTTSSSTVVKESLENREESDNSDLKAASCFDDLNSGKCDVKELSESLVANSDICDGSQDINASTVVDNYNENLEETDDSIDKKDVQAESNLDSKACKWNDHLASEEKLQQDIDALFQKLNEHLSDSNSNSSSTVDDTAKSTQLSAVCDKKLNAETVSLSFHHLGSPTDLKKEKNTEHNISDSKSAKKFKCEACGKGFKYPGLFAKHQKSHLANDKSVVTDDMDKSVMSLTNCEVIKQDQSKGLDSVANASVDNEVALLKEAEVAPKRSHQEANFSRFQETTKSESEACEDKVKKVRLDEANGLSLAPSVENVFKTKCDICGKRFKSLDKLLDHTKTHNIQDVEDINVNSEKISTEQSGNESIDNMKSAGCSGTIPFYLNLDNQKSTQSASVDSDAISLSSAFTSISGKCASNRQRSVKCVVCGKRFGRADRLTEHLKQHSYMEDISGDDSKEISEVHNSDVESRSSSKAGTSAKPHKCKCCGRRFSCSEMFAKHVQAHQELNDSRDNSKNHTAVSNAEIESAQGYQSDLNSSVSEGPDLEAARPWKPKKCDICGKRLHTEQKYNIHMKSHMADTASMHFATTSEPTDNEGSLSNEITETEDVKNFSANVSKTTHIEDTRSASDVSKTQLKSSDANANELLPNNNEANSTTSDKAKYKSHLATHKVSSLSSNEDELSKKGDLTEGCMLEKNRDIQTPKTAAVPSKTANRKCDICGKRFKNDPDLELHRKSHLEQPEDDYQDENDSKMSISPPKKPPTESSVKPSKPTKCQVCGKRLKNSSALETHMRQHEVDSSDKSDDLCSETSPVVETDPKKSEEPPKTEENHGKLADSKSDRVASSRERQHSETGVSPPGDKPKPETGKATPSGDKHKPEVVKGKSQGSKHSYKCKVCGKSFDHSKRLDRHMKRHKSSERKSADRSSRQHGEESSLEKIEKMQNAEDESTSDSLMGNGESFLNDSKTTLDSIQDPDKEDPGENDQNPGNKEEPKEFKCGICGKKFNLSKLLKKHLKIHQVLSETLNEGDRRLIKSGKPGVEAVPENSTSFMAEAEADQAKKEFVAKYKIPKRQAKKNVPAVSKDPGPFSGDPFRTGAMNPRPTSSWCHPGVFNQGTNHPGAKNPGFSSPFSSHPGAKNPGPSGPFPSDAGAKKSYPTKPGGAVSWGEMMQDFLNHETSTPRNSISKRFEEIRSDNRNSVPEKSDRRRKSKWDEPEDVQMDLDFPDNTSEKSDSQEAPALNPDGVDVKSDVAGEEKKDGVSDEKDSKSPEEASFEVSNSDVRLLQRLIRTYLRCLKKHQMKLQAEMHKNPLGLGSDLI